LAFHFPTTDGGSMIYGQTILISVYITSEQLTIG